MLRKVTLGLIAAASLGAAALAPSAASAHGWHHGWGGVGFGGIYVNTGVSNCYQQQWVETRRGMRMRTVNVCGYNVY